MTELTYRVRYALRGHLVDPLRPPAPFRYLAGPGPVSVRLFGETRASATDRSWVNLCDSEIVIDIDEVALQDFERLAEGYVPMEVISFEPAYISTLQDQKGRLHPDAKLPVRFLSVAARTVVDLAEPAVFELALRTVTVARWRLGIPGPHQPLRAESRHFRTTADWRHLPFYVPEPQWLTSSGQLGERFRAEVQAIVASGGREPLGRELYREASVGRYERRRSALALAAAAVEAGLLSGMSLLSQAAPPKDSRTPPLRVMLDEYLPAVAALRPINSRALLPPASVLTTIRKTHGQRNELMHGGTVLVEQSEIDAALEAAHGLLCFLDFYAGHGWALEFVDAQVLAEAARSVGLESPGDLIRLVWRDTGVNQSTTFEP